MTSKMQSEPSDKRVVLQRVRNRMIEVLELTAGFDAQHEYQRNVPFVGVPNEVINQWEDWYHHDPSLLESPVFTDDERRAVVAFDEAWNAVCDATPNPLPHLSETQSLARWGVLRDAAGRALATLMERGKLSEEQPIKTA